MSLTPEQIARETVILRLSTHSLGLRKKLATADVAPDADEALVHVGKDVLDKGAEPIKAIRKADSQAAAWIKMRRIENPILAAGSHLIPLRLIPDVREFLAWYSRKREDLVWEFCAQYEDLKADARDRLAPQGLYDPDDYPDVDAVREAFSVEWSFDASINLPEAMREHRDQVYRAVYAEQRDRAESQWREATEEIRQALREGFRVLVSHMASQLAPDPQTGKPRKLYDSMLEKVTTFLDGFEARDLTRDGELGALVAQARQIAIGVTTDGLRQDGTMREHVGAAMGRISEAIDGMISTVPGRRIRLDDEPSAADAA